jgi:hypothetical protein
LIDSLYLHLSFLRLRLVFVSRSLPRSKRKRTFLFPTVEDFAVIALSFCSRRVRITNSSLILQQHLSCFSEHLQGISLKIRSIRSRSTSSFDHIVRPPFSHIPKFASSIYFLALISACIGGHSSCIDRASANHCSCPACIFLPSEWSRARLRLTFSTSPTSALTIQTSCRNIVIFPTNTLPTIFPPRRSRTPPLRCCGVVAASANALAPPALQRAQPITSLALSSSTSFAHFFYCFITQITLPQ